MSRTDSLTSPRRWQIRIFAVSWLTYAGYYLGRVNISVAMPALQESFGWSRAALGLLGSLFFWVYAFSQLINGHVGDRVSARRFIAVGLLLSAGLNALAGSLSTYGLLVLVWAINGWAQATGWGPMMRTLSRWFSPKQRGRLTAFFAPCYVVGNAFAWMLAGWMIAVGGWRWAFWGPAILLVAIAGMWFWGVRDRPTSSVSSPNEAEPAANGSIWQGLIALWQRPAMRSALAICLLSGMIKDGLTLWGPTYLMEQGNLPLTTAALIAVALPIAGALGAFLAGWLMHRWTQDREMPVVAGLAALVVVSVAGLYIWAGASAAAVSLALLAMMALGSHGTNALLMASVPLSLGPRGNVSSAAGTLDFTSYVGGGLSALLVGALQDLAGWSAVYLWWGVVAAVIAVIAIGAARSPVPVAQSKEHAGEIPRPSPAMSGSQPSSSGEE